MAYNYVIRSITTDDNLVRLWLYEEGTEPSEGVGLDFPVPNVLTDETLKFASEARIREYLDSVVPPENQVSIIDIPQSFTP